MDSVKIIIRSAVPNDKNFILSTWLKGQRYGNNQFNEIPEEIYFVEHAKVINRIIFTPGVQILVACAQNQPNWIVGFAVLSDESIYWLHVKKDYRMRGVAKLLVGDRQIKSVKALTRMGLIISKRKRLIFNPF